MKPGTAATDGAAALPLTLAVRQNTVPPPPSPMCLAG